MQPKKKSLQINVGVGGRKRGLLALLVGMELCVAATMENSMEFCGKLKNRVAMGPSNPTSGHI